MGIPNSTFSINPKSALLLPHCVQSFTEIWYYFSRLNKVFISFVAIV
jgi:hypothetical protein